MTENKSNSSAVVRIVIWSVVAFLLLSLLVAGLMSSRIGVFGFSMYNYDDPESYNNGAGNSDAEIKKLDIDWISGNVKVVAYDGDEIKISESRVDDDDEKKQLRWKVEDGTLIVKYCAPRSLFSFFSMFGKDLTVSIPSNMAENLDEIKCVTVSSGISYEGTDAKKVRINSTSGDIDFVGKADDLGIGSVSGSIEVDCTRSETVKINTTSGDVTFRGVCTGKTGIGSVSGVIDVEGSFAKIDFGTTSGDIKLSLDDKTEYADCHSVSGRITVKLPQDKGFTASLGSVSGDVRIDGEIFCKHQGEEYIAGDGSTVIKTNTTSGDLFISYK